MLNNLSTYRIFSSSIISICTLVNDIIDKVAQLGHIKQANPFLVSCYDRGLRESLEDVFVFFIFLLYRNIS